MNFKSSLELTIHSDFEDQKFFKSLIFYECMGLDTKRHLSSRLLGYSVKAISFKDAKANHNKDSWIITRPLYINMNYSIQLNV